MSKEIEIQHMITQLEIRMHKNKLAGDTDGNLAIQGALMALRWARDLK